MKLWISLLEATALPGTEYFGYGAYVNGLALAASAPEAVAALGEALHELGWRLVAAEDTEEFDQRCASHEVEADLKELARVALETQRPQLGTFHAWLESQPNH